MMTVHAIVTVLLVVAGAPLLMWWASWLAYALLALLPMRRPGAVEAQTTHPMKIDILIPAHDEELLLPKLFESLKGQTAPDRIGQILVVADHCSDHTAELARAVGASVLERDADPRGKPAALRDGLAWLATATANATANPVLILDADCIVSPNLVERTTAALDRGALVTQAAYILDTPQNTQRLHTPAMIAFALKNHIRPRGMARVGIPTQLFGTGMCFHPTALATVRFDDHLTEDLAISHALLLAGIEPQVLPDALVRSPLPEDRRAMSTQKLRWETGQIRTWSKLPVILLRLLARLRLRAAVALLDWSAPPLAMAVLYGTGVAFALLLAVASRWSPPAVLFLPLAAIACLIGYVIIGGSQVSGAAAVWRLLWATPRFVAWKLALYAQIFAGRAPVAWERTPRKTA